jgi:hypothetical protein
LTAEWLSTARIGGAELFSEMTESEIVKVVDQLHAEHVSVIEADSDLSRYLTDVEFDAEVALARRFTEIAHRKGMRVVWYYPALEVLSPKARQGGKSMRRDHPSWVQVGIDGKPNVFYGGRGRVHWVDSSTESAWMSVHSGFVDYYLDRIRRLTLSGVDGIWLDVPLYNDIGTAWADLGSAAVAKFKAETGLTAPRIENWSDPTWRRWIRWRYDQIAEFIVRIRDAAQHVNGAVSIIVEDVTLDNGSVTMLGLDGSLFKKHKDIVQVWEVDALSDQSAMRASTPIDWLSLIGMSKYGKAASGTKPSWMFTYGEKDDDALLVMATAFAAGNHPYETKIPQMTTTVGSAYRTRLFSWMERNNDRLFKSAPAATVAIFYSPESRDYVDHGKGTGLFSTVRRGDTKWWSDESNNSVQALTYLAEYRGYIKWLSENHVPFEIVVHPDLKELSTYQLVVAPALMSISNDDAATLDAFVSAGGKLVVTGPSALTLDEFGNGRTSPTPLSTGIIKVEAMHGHTLMTQASQTANDAIKSLILSRIERPIEVGADRHVHIEIRRLDQELIVHLINPEHIWSPNAPSVRNIEISLPWHEGQQQEVSATSPDDSAPEKIITATTSGGKLRFMVPLKAYAMVSIRQTGN